MKKPKKTKKTNKMILLFFILIFAIISIFTVIQNFILINIFKSLSENIFLQATLLGLGVSLILSILITLVIYSIIKPIKLVGSTISDIAKSDADLTRRIDINRNDEIGDLINGFNQFIEKIQNIISSVKHSKQDLVSVEKKLQQSVGDTRSEERRVGKEC